jgi:predicted AlkP superfamily pyrophosphatase or phosphodiesterase
MSTGRKRLLVIEVAALGRTLSWAGPTLRLTQSVFPALTCPVQASFRTASAPGVHGVVANGVFLRELRKTSFWEQSAALVRGERIWRGFRARGGRVAMLFWQQSLGEDVDIVLSPAPIHKHHGGMIQDCYSQPAGLYDRLARRLGPFKLRQYWGPLASARVGDWIAEATVAVLDDADLAPDLCLTYLPTLDYDLQRSEACEAGSETAPWPAAARQLDRLFHAARDRGYHVLVLGDYRIARVSGAAFPNRALRQAGLMQTRNVRGMLYPDLYSSRAFAMVDHEVAHVYVRNEADVPVAAETLRACDGIGDVFDRAAQQDRGVAHANAGELVLVARERTWFAYPWWRDRAEAPDYACHVDIHSKPGYDPCELFFGWPPPAVSQDPARVRGSHGRTGAGREVAWAATFELGAEPTDLVKLAAGVKQWLDAE